MWLLLGLLCVVLGGGVAWAEHLLPQAETLECGPRNHYCGRTLGHDGPQIPTVDDALPRVQVQAGCVPEHNCGQERLVYPSDIAPCLAQMEQAMRAMDRYIPPLSGNRAYRNHGSAGDGGVTIEPMPNYLWPRNDRYHDVRSLDQQQKDLESRYGHAQEHLGRDIVDDAHERFAYRQWEQVKQQCWRQP